MCDKFQTFFHPSRARTREKQTERKRGRAFNTRGKDRMTGLKEWWSKSKKTQWKNDRFRMEGERCSTWNIFPLPPWHGLFISSSSCQSLQITVFSFVFGCNIHATKSSLYLWKDSHTHEHTHLLHMLSSERRRVFRFNVSSQRHLQPSGHTLIIRWLEETVPLYPTSPWLTNPPFFDRNPVVLILHKNTWCFHLTARFTKLKSRFTYCTEHKTLISYLQAGSMLAKNTIWI